MTLDTLDTLYTKLYRTRRDYYFGVYGMRTQQALVRKMKRILKEIGRRGRQVPMRYYDPYTREMIVNDAERKRIAQALGGVEFPKGAPCIRAEAIMNAANL